MRFWQRVDVRRDVQRARASPRQREKRKTESMASRGAQTTFTVFLALLLYAISLFYRQYLPPTLQTLLPVLPWALLVAFGAYALGSIGWALVTFKECPEAKSELLKEIDMARKELSAKMNLDAGLAR